jgi:hypothetical protein
LTIKSTSHTTPADGSLARNPAELGYPACERYFFALRIGDLAPMLTLLVFCNARQYSVVKDQENQPISFQ